MVGAGEEEADGTGSGGREIYSQPLKKRVVGGRKD